MNLDDINAMAEKAGAKFDHMTWVERDLAPVFYRFAELVADHVRQECIDIVAFHGGSIEIEADIRSRSSK